MTAIGQELEPGKNGGGKIAGSVGQGVLILYSFLQLGKHWDEVEVARDVARTRISRSSSFEQAIVLDVAMAGSP
jgi:hypothetical protein